MPAVVYTLTDAEKAYLTACGCTQCGVVQNCCQDRNIATVLNCDFASACAGYNGSFTLTYNALTTQWRGTFTSDVCGSECQADYVFACIRQNPGDEPAEYAWRLTSVGEGGFVGCEGGACVAGGFRQASASGLCSGPLDVELTGGTMQVGLGCSCCSGVDVFARVYE